MKIQLNANQTNRLDIVGNYIRIMDGSEPVRVTVGNDTQRQTIEMQRGTGFEPVFTFTYVEIISDITQQIDLTVTAGRVDDNRLSGFVETKPQTSQNLIVSVHQNVLGDPVLIAAGDAGRRRIIIHNDGADAALIGGADVVQNGMTLAAGEKMIVEFSASAEFYAVSSSANALTIRVLEETDTYVTGTQPPADAMTTENGAYLYTENGNYLIQQD